MAKNQKTQKTDTDPTQAPETRDISDSDFVANILPLVSLNVARALSTGASQEKGRWDAPSCEDQVRKLESLRPILGSEETDKAIAKARAEFEAPENPFVTLQKVARTRVKALGGKTKALRT